MLENIEEFESKLQAVLLNQYMHYKMEQCKEYLRMQQRGEEIPERFSIVELGSQTTHTDTRKDALEPSDESTAETESSKPIKKAVYDPQQELAKLKTSDASGAEIIFNKALEIFNSLRKNSNYALNQSLYQQCIKVAVASVEHLNTDASLALDLKKYIYITQKMFQFYFKNYKSDKKMLALHLDFRSKLEKGDPLATLLEKDPDTAFTEKDLEAQSQSLETPEDTHAIKLKESPTQLNIKYKNHWHELRSLQIDAKVLCKELASLSYNIGAHIYANKYRLKRPEWQEIITLALKVEAYYFEQLQQINAHVSKPAKSLQKAAHYFKLLYIHYKASNESEAFVEEIRKQYVIMDDRATNYEQMLACYYVETSKKTSSSEKASARDLRQSYQEEQKVVIDLCAQFKSLSHPLSNPDLVQSPSSSMESTTLEEKHRLLETEMLLGKSSSYAIYLNARRYLNAVLNHVFANSSYEITHIPQVDNYFDPEIMEIDEDADSEQFLAALTSDYQILRDAIQLYYQIKCNYVDYLQKKHPEDNFLRSEQFYTHFRREAYAYLFQLSTHIDSANKSLLQKNCLDILESGNCLTPLLKIIARHYLGILHADTEEVTVRIEDDSADREVTLRHKHRLIAESEVVKTAETPTQMKLADEKTIWEKICSELEVYSVRFSDYQSQILDEDVSDDTADYLYQIITDINRRLVIDESEVELFFKIYEKLLQTYFVPREYQTLEDLINQHIKKTKLKTNAAIPSSEIMFKSIKLGQAIVQYSLMFSYSLQLQALLNLADLYMRLIELTPKRSFIKEAEEIYRKAVKIARELNDDDKVILIIQKIKEIKKLPLQTDDKNLEAFYESEKRKFREKMQKNTEEFQQISKAPFDYDKHEREVLIEYAEHEFIYQVKNIVFFILGNTKDWINAYDFFQHLCSITDRSLAQFFGNMNAMNTWYRGLIKEPDNPNMAYWLTRYYLVVLAEHEKINQIKASKKIENKSNMYFNFSEKTESLLDLSSQELSALLIRIQAEGVSIDDLPSIGEVTETKVARFPVHLPEKLTKTQGLTTPVKDALTLIDSHKYWQACSIFLADGLKSDRKAFQQISLIKAFLINWVTKIISTQQFIDLYVNSSPEVQESYSSTKKLLKSELKKCVAKFSKDKSLARMYNADIESHSHITACSIFASSYEDELRDFQSPTVDKSDMQSGTTCS